MFFVELKRTVIDNYRMFALRLSFWLFASLF